MEKRIICFIPGGTIFPLNGFGSGIILFAAGGGKASSLKDGAEPPASVEASNHFCSGSWLF